jgi:hypothetical protein
MSDSEAYIQSQSGSQDSIRLTIAAGFHLRYLYHLSSTLAQLLLQHIAF